MAPLVVYSVGKGGVGKTTCAAALAVHVAKTRRTLVASLDPAHNLGDVLEKRLNGTPKEVDSGLWACEVNMDAAIARYLSDSSDRLKQMYGHLKVINLEGYLDALKLSPGIEEYATLQALQELLQKADGQYDVVVFDTPPTGLTLRVLALPSVSLMWGERLMKLRREILDKRRTIENIQGEKRFVLEGKEYKLPTDVKSDRVMTELVGYVAGMRGLNALQSDSRSSRVMPVMNADRLSLFETNRALESLGNLGMAIGPIIVNKVGMKTSDERTIENIRKELRRPLRMLPFIDAEPVGMEAIGQIAERLDFEEWVPGHKPSG